MAAPEYDAVVVGSGPNGLVAAVTLAEAGLAGAGVEAQDDPGRWHALGGADPARVRARHLLGDPLRSAWRHRPCATCRSRTTGVEWIHPDVPLAHPLDGGRAALLHRSVDETAAGLGGDAAPTGGLGPLVASGIDLVDGLLDPF